MKKLWMLLPILVLILVFALLALTACGEPGVIAQHAAETQTPPAPVEASPAQNEAPPADTEALEPIPEPLRAWTVEELGETIVAAGTFWEDWWSLRGRFGWEHFDVFEFEPLPEHYVTFSDEHHAWLARQDELMALYRARFPEGLLDRGAFEILLPSSGFTSLNDIRGYLLQYYTEAWIDAELSGDFAAFVEYDGTLFVDITRAGFGRPDWSTAAHTLVEQDGGHAVVETTVSWGAWHRIPYGYDGDGYEVIGEVLYRFTFIDGKINAVHTDADFR